MFSWCAKDAIVGSQQCAPGTVMAPTRRRTPGLLLRRGIWHIDKIIYGKRICESTRTGDRIEAEALLARRVTQARHVHFFGEPCEHSFREAATKFLAENQHKRSLERDRRALAVLDPSILSLAHYLCNECITTRWHRTSDHGSRKAAARDH